MMKRKGLFIFLSIISLFILVSLLGLSLLVSSPLKTIVEKEAGEEITDLSFYKNPTLFQFIESKGIHLLNCKMITDIEKLELDKVGDYPIQFLVNGKNRSSILKIKDSISPELNVKDVIVPAGEKVSLDDFILAVTDATKLSLKNKGLSNYDKKKKAGTYDIIISAIDDGGNKTTVKSKLYALPLKRKAVVQLGSNQLSADVFLKSKKETGFQLSFKEGFDIIPLLRDEGKYTVPVTVLMEEKKRNLELKLEVKDTKPPVFIGVKDRAIGLGEKISYRTGVEVKDNQAEEVEFKVDASRVNSKREGSYPVFYFAKDKAGNKTEKKMTVHVLSSKKSHFKEVRAYVEESMKELINDNMSEVEKLRKIFDFCHQIRYTGSSNKDDIIEAAYEGFRTKTGDCFTYYAVARLLLTEAGFAEEMVTRKDGSSKHYWNLVKFQDEWYHFDSCPIAASDGFVPFMVNDEELVEFSKKYGARFPDRKGYYHFEKEKYPDRAKEPFNKKSDS